jgi:hypothetical protein
MTSYRPSARAALAFSIAVALASLAATTGAQAPAAAPAPVVLPKPDCGEKPDHPGKLGSDNQKRQWRKDANAYLECFSKYVTEQRGLAQRYQDAANALIDQYNTAVREMQATIDAAAQ